jgi:S1-C subfamily serine protease
MRTRLPASAALLATLALALAGCGGSSDSKTTTAAAAAGKTVTVTNTVDETTPSGGSARAIDANRIYKEQGPGVVTVVSFFTGSGAGGLLGGGGEQEGVGSGFVLSTNGEIATNAHVVTSGSGKSLARAQKVYVRFADTNEVPATIVGTDPNSDVALIRVDPKGLNLHPLTLGQSNGLQVGSPVAAIGSPFDEPQSLSVGVISATNRDIDSLNGTFQIPGAIQTDAAINHGNSGGPLIDANGRVLGINSQIQSTGGGGEGVGFAVPIDLVKHSLSELRTDHKVSYAFLGVSTAALFPQLVAHFHLGAPRGVWLQRVSPGGPADKAGLRAGTRTETFQTERVAVGGDIITKVDTTNIVGASDLNRAIGLHRAGDTVTLTVYRGTKRRLVSVKLAERPLSAASAQTTP